MNVIVSNKNKDLLSSLNVDVIKSVTGEYTVDEIIHMFSSFFYSRMFLDITAIKNYSDLREIQKLSIGLDISKIIFLLDNSDACNSGSYISKLISMGIYNFTKTKEGLDYLYNHPNGYRDVAHLQQLENVAAEISEKITNKVESRNNNTINENINNNYDSSNEISSSNTYIIGFKNITSHAGSTTLIYMLKRQLSTYYKVVAIEVNRKDFLFFNDPEMISIKDTQLKEEISKHMDADIILLDLNDCNYELDCNDVLYLIEPSTIKLNKMIMINRNIFQKLYDKKVVLNKSLLNSKDVDDFERESNSKIFYNLPPLNDKEDNTENLLPLLDKMGLISNNKEKSNNGKILGLFKF